MLCIQRLAVSVDWERLKQNFWDLAISVDYLAMPCAAQWIPTLTEVYVQHLCSG